MVPLRNLVVTAALAIAVAVPESHTFGKATAADLEASERLLLEEDARRREAEAIQAWRSALAHARLSPSTRSTALADVCPVFGSDLPGRGSEKESRRPFSARNAPRPTRWNGVAAPSESAQSLFSEYISGPVVQAKCVNCHVDGGVSGHTRLVLSTAENPDHASLNLAAFQNFLDTVEDGADRILNKVQGVGHGGGIQVPAGSADFANMERFLRLLGGGGTTSGLSPETLFDGVTLASPAKTLRRAALIFAGRLPTQAELDAVSDGRVSSLRRAIRNVMTGPGFHEFLIRASNDRLLTDRHITQVIDANDAYFVDLANTNWEMGQAAFDRGYEHRHRDGEVRNWEAAVDYGISRAPLELIAHVVENDLPYTKILTADYIMANPFAARAYGASTRFDNPDDPYEFRPSRIVSYYRNDDSKVTIEDERTGARWVANPGNLSTVYPHAGILNATVFLLRYPTTATNRNRARSRWTYYHFLGVDIEKSAARTTDPDALADTDNPTMKNPACTVCHQVMDPVAGAYQNYGEEGLYRDEWGGMDSLARLYKRPGDGSESLYHEGDTWYRDMREPGFGGALAPSPDNSLQWLAGRIAADPRFAEATVKFWWPAIMGAEVTLPPEDEGDADFAARLAAATAQQTEVEHLASAFRRGIAGGEPFNGRDLLAEIALSPWFRAESVAGSDPVREAALSHAGVERLLSPEELERKTEAITGYVWGRRLSQNVEQGRETHLNSPRAEGSRYELMYGGIDSDGITVRARELTPLMAAVAQKHAIEVSCPVVLREFYLLPDAERRLFRGIDMTASPVSETHAAAAITAESLATPQTVSLNVSLAAGAKTVRLAFTNDFYDRETQDDRNLYLDAMVIRNRSGAVVERIEFENLAPQAKPDCNYPGATHFRLNCEGSLDVAVSIPEDGEYRIDVIAYQEAGGDEPARLEVTVESDGDTSQGARAIRYKLAELHEVLFGVTVGVDSPDVEQAFQMFREVWERKRGTDGGSFPRTTCNINDSLYLDGIADDTWQYNRWGHSGISQRGWDLIWGAARSDPHHVADTWAVVLAYLLTDYRYLYL